MDISVGADTTELLVSPTSFTKGGLDYRSRQCTVSFPYPRIHRYYISLTIHSSNGTTSDWISGIHDCYLLYSKSLTEPFSCFDGGVPLCGLHESDKEIEMECKISSLQMWVKFRYAFLLSNYYMVMRTKS